MVLSALLPTLVLAAPSPADRLLTLDSGGLALSFRTEGSRLSWVGLVSATGRQWLSLGGGSLIWRLAFRGPDGAAAEVAGSEADLASSDVGDGRAAFTWRAELARGARADVTVGVQCQRGSSLSYWTLQVEPPAGWQVTRADFPVIPNIRQAKRLQMAAPVGWGLEYQVKPGTSYQGTYPSLVAAMQFVTFYDGGEALYLAAHDATASHKDFSVKAGEDAIFYQCTNWPALSVSERDVLLGRDFKSRPNTNPNTYRLPYQAIVGIVEGGYWEAAQVYREFALKTRWGRGGPVSKRPIPQWLKDIDLWLMPAPEPLTNAEPCKKAAAYFGAPTALHWYNWHEIPFDTLYPDYFPAKPGFAEGVRALKEAGMHLMPYINGRLCDPNSHAWTQEHADRSAARRENGEPYIEVYGSNVPLNVMCPYTPYWQQKIAGLVDRLVNECGVSGVYIDQISAAAAVRCFESSHGHPPGGGSMWVDSYKKMLDQARSRLPKEAVLTTEENAECWIDQFDALLLVNTPPTWGAKPIPLFPSVYGGRAITFGFQYIAADDLKLSVPFRAKMARAFVWGSQLGWVSVDAIISPEAAAEAEFLRNLARCRRFGHKWLAYGAFLGMLEVFGDKGRVRSQGASSVGGTYKIDMPAVIASAWLAQDRSVAVAIANMSDEAREVEVPLPLKAGGLTAGKDLAVQGFGPEGPVPVPRPAHGMQKVTIDARSGMLIAVRAR